MLQWLLSFSYQKGSTYQRDPTRLTMLREAQGVIERKVRVYLCLILYSCSAEIIKRFGAPRLDHFHQTRPVAEESEAKMGRDPMAGASPAPHAFRRRAAQRRAASGRPTAVRLARAMCRVSLWFVPTPPPAEGGLHGT